MSLNLILAIGFGVFGVLIGSFLNVLILRYNTGKGIGGRSQCFSCGRSLTAIDLFPIFSYLFSRGRCRTCKSKISKQYVLVEMVTGFLFVLAYAHNAHLLGGLVHGGMPALGVMSSVGLFALKSAIDCLLMSLLVFMAGYDIRHKIIPDLAVFVFAGCALVGSLIVPGFSWWLIASGPLLALPFYAIWLLSRGRWMGLGDAKLALGFGWMMPLSLAGTAVIFGFWVGAAYAILIMLLRPDIALSKKLWIVCGAALALALEMKYGMIYIPYAIVASVIVILLIPVLLSLTPFLKRLTRWGHLPALQMKSEVPFAPFLITGLLIVYVLGYNLFTFGI